MLGRILGSRTTNSSQEVQVDCFECRMIGGSGLTGLGAYIVYYAFQKRNQPSVGRMLMFGSGFLGSVIMTMGILRLAGVHEWSQPRRAPKQITTPTEDKELLK